MLIELPGAGIELPELEEAMESVLNWLKKPEITKGRGNGEHEKVKCTI